MVEEKLRAVLLGCKCSDGYEIVFLLLLVNGCRYWCFCGALEHWGPFPAGVIFLVATLMKALHR